MVNRIVEREGQRWRVEGVIDHWQTGERMVVITRYRTIEEILDQGCSWGETGHWAVPAKTFKLEFKVTHEV